jgi:hypothetical protein
VTAWLRWWSEHGAEPRERWIAEGEAAAVASLSSPDPVVRFAAIRRLEASPAHSAQSAAALAALLAQPDLAAPARFQILRYARSHAAPH